MMLLVSAGGWGVERRESSNQQLGSSFTAPYWENMLAGAVRRRAALEGAFSGRVLPGWNLLCVLGTVRLARTVSLQGLCRSKKQFISVLKGVENELVEAGMSAVRGE